MTDAHLTRTDLVRAFFQQLEKLAKTVDLYGARSSPVERSAREALLALEATLGVEPDLELRVLPYEFHVGDDVVYQNHDPNRSLAFALYRDGVRKLTFHRDFTTAELLELLRILRTDLRAAPEESVVTLLWAHRFRGLSYYAIEDLFEGEEAFEDTSYDPQEIAQAVRTRRGGTMGCSTMSLSSRELEAVVGSTSHKPERIFHRAHVFEVSPAELARLHRESVEPASRRLDRFLNVVLDVLKHERDPAEVERALAVLAQLGSSFAASGQYGAALPLARGQTALAQALSWAGQEEKARSIRTAVATLATDAAARTVLAALGGREEREGALAWVLEVGTPLITPLARALGGATSDAARAAAVEAIARLSDGKLDPLLGALDLPAPPVELIHLLGRLKDERIPPLLIGLATALDQESSLAAVGVMAVDFHPSYVPLLLGMLDAREEGIRLAALRALGASNDRKAADLVARRTRARGFNRLSQNERRAHFLVVALAGGDKALPQISALLQKKTFFRRLHPETRLCALQAVGTLASEAAIEVLRAEAARSTDEMVRAACDRLVKEVSRRLERSSSAAEVRDTQQLRLEQSTRSDRSEIAAALEEDELLQAQREALAEQVDLSASAKRRLIVNCALAERMTAYEVLGVAPDARVGEIRAAYQLLLTRYDLKRYRGKELGTFGQRISSLRRQVEIARDTLLNPVRRRRYDQERKERRGKP